MVPLEAMKKLAKPRGKVVDTDVFIWYFRGNKTAEAFFNRPDQKIYFARTTLRELLPIGISTTERGKILTFLRRFRQIGLDARVTKAYDKLIQKYPEMKGRPQDALIAATALSRRFVLVTGNARHYRIIRELELEVFHPLRGVPGIRSYGGRNG